jgi:acetate kinase
MRIVVVNSGSSSIKYESFDLDGLVSCSAGNLERIGTEDSRLTHRWRTAAGGWDQITQARPVPDHQQGFRLIWRTLADGRCGSGSPDICAVGHRVVHGGEKFKEPALIDDASIATIDELSPLAPLHNPANVTGIKVMRQLLPEVPQVAVFDTAFHQTMPPRAFRYAIADEYYREYGVRRYGFHGLSHRYVSREAARHLGAPLKQLNLITLHLGNGASAAALERGVSIDTSMGLTPLEGLIMGTRCGDIDAAVPFYLQRQTGRPFQEIEPVLNRQSGLKGICGSNDMRDILRRADEQDAQAQLAFEMFCYRIKKYVGAYCAVLGSVDALVFTGGIGENAPRVRAAACHGLSRLGITLDQQRNNTAADGIAEIQAEHSTSKILVIPTDEEREIAQQVLQLLKDRPHEA